MTEKKANNFQSPDLNKLQAVIVDYKTTIFIPLGANPEKERKRYLELVNNKFLRRR